MKEKIQLDLQNELDLAHGKNIKHKFDKSGKLKVDKKHKKLHDKENL